MLTCCLFLYLKFLKKINFFLVFSNHFNILISKIIFLKKNYYNIFSSKKQFKEQLPLYFQTPLQKSEIDEQREFFYFQFNFFFITLPRLFHINLQIYVY